MTVSFLVVMNMMFWRVRFSGCINYMGEENSYKILPGKPDRRQTTFEIQV
jgi:hypothetical protein